jgi:hypothetical protein
MEQSEDIEKYRRKLFDRLIAIRTVYGNVSSFEQLWYEFLMRHLASAGPMERVFVQFCNELEKRCSRKCE